MNKSRKGFTLVELLVVIAIIAIIAAVAVPVTITQIDKAKAGAAVEEANNVKKTIVIAVADYGFSSDFSAANLAKDMNDNFATMEQCTDIVVMKDDIAVTFYILTKIPAKADNASKGYVAKNVALSSSGDKFVTVQYQLPSKGIIFKDVYLSRTILEYNTLAW